VYAKINSGQKSYFFIRLCISWIMYEMYSSYKYFIYDFLFMCLFMHFIVYWGHTKFVYEFMFLMYLVMDHMYWVCCVFEYSSSIWSVTGTIINSFYFVLFYIYIYKFFLIFSPPHLIVFIYLFVHIWEKWTYRWKKRTCIWAGCACINRHRDIGVYEICRNRRRKAKRWW